MKQNKCMELCSTRSKVGRGVCKERRHSGGFEVVSEGSMTSGSSKKETATRAEHCHAEIGGGEGGQFFERRNRRLCLFFFELVGDTVVKGLPVGYIGHFESSAGSLREPGGRSP